MIPREGRDFSGSLRNPAGAPGHRWVQMDELGTQGEELTPAMHDLSLRITRLRVDILGGQAFWCTEKGQPMFLLAPRIPAYPSNCCEFVDRTKDQLIPVWKKIKIQYPFPTSFWKVCELQKKFFSCKINLFFRNLWEYPQMVRFTMSSHFPTSILSSLNISSNLHSWVSPSALHKRSSNIPGKNTY